MIITYNEKSKKFLKISLMIIALILFVFIIGIIILKYEVEGENIENMPFKIAGITVASTVDAIKNEDNENLWNLNLLQINDIYIKIEMNNNKENDIKSVKIQDISIENSNIGNNKVTKLVSNNYNNENMETIEFTGKTATNLEELTISKQGGTIGFRYIIQDIGKYISNDEQVTYNMELLEKIGITRETLLTNFNFNIVVELENDIKYIANIKLELPVDGENVKSIDISEIIFKRLLQN